MCRIVADVTCVGHDNFQHKIAVEPVSNVTAQDVSDFDVRVNFQFRNGSWGEWRIRPTTQPSAGVPNNSGKSELTVEILGEDLPMANIKHKYDCVFAEWQEQNNAKIVNFYVIGRSTNWWTWSFQLP